MRTTLSAALGFGILLGALGTSRADDPADAKKIIEKGIQAAGTEKAAKYKAATWKMKGNFHGLGMPIPYTGSYAFETPDKFRMTLEFDAGGQQATFAVVYNAGKAWRKFNDDVAELEGEKLDEQKEAMYFIKVSRLLVLREPGFTLKSLGESQVENKPALGVQVSSKGHRDVGLYFDKGTGLLVKTEMRVKDDQTGVEANQETFYSDYKDLNGFKHPAKIVIKRDGQLYIESEAQDYKLEEKLDKNVFEKP